MWDFPLISSMFLLKSQESWGIRESYKAAEEAGNRCGANCNLNSDLFLNFSFKENAEIVENCP